MVVNLPWTNVVSFAQATGWREMGRRFREGGAEFDPTGLILALAAVSVLVLLLWLLSKFLMRDDERPFHGPVRLFWQLCRAHELDARECWLLWRLARAHGLRQPAELFIDADRFAASNLPKAMSREQRRLDRLRSRLFHLRDESDEAPQ